MKQFEIENLEEISNLNMANLFNVYDEPKLGTNYKTYSINRSINFVNLDESSTDNVGVFLKYTTELMDTLPLISYKFYGTIELWWLVAKVNNIVDPTIDLKIGTKIRVLQSEVANQVLENIRGN
jgi:hypothetical protein